MSKNTAISHANSGSNKHSDTVYMKALIQRSGHFHIEY